VAIAEAFATNPGLSIPRLFATRSDVKAAYTLFDHVEAAPDNVQAAHAHLVREAMQEAGIYLLIEDTTEMSWAGSEPIEGLGPIGPTKEGKLGFLLHSTLGARWDEALLAPAQVARPPLDVLGMVDQQYDVRVPRPPGEKRSDSRGRKKRARESQVWARTTERVGPAPASAQVQWVRVCDAGGDIYEHLVECQQAGHRFRIRSGQERCLVERAGQREASGLLHEVARAAAPVCGVELALRARPGQAARVAQLSVSAVEVLLRAPQRPGHGAGALAPIACTAVRVWEAAPPEGVEALEWILLCDPGQHSAEAALRCALQYSARAVVEEFHKALKTGLGAERLQLKTAARLYAAIAVMSVVALRLVALREAVRCDPAAPAARSGLDALELAVLGEAVGTTFGTVREVALAVGRLGGHLNRSSDGLPGWQTLWHGMVKLRTLAHGARLAEKLRTRAARKR
jgi:hypothetical protein